MKGICCRLVDPSGRELTGEVRGLQRTREDVLLQVLFGPGEDVPLPLGDTLDLSLFGPDLYRPHEFRGRTMRRSRRCGREAYDFRIDPGRRFELDLVIGGRDSLRVQAPADQPVNVDLWTPGADTPLVRTLHDASVSGLSVEVEWGDEKRMVATRSVRAAVHLPGAREVPQPIPGVIRRRTLDGQRIVYGVAFDPGLTPASHPGLRSLAAWVEARYAELSGGARVLRRSA